MRAMPDRKGTTDSAARLEGFFARYGPALAGLGRALRARLRARLPGLFEIVYVYGNQDALVIAYAPTEKGYEGVCTLDLRPSGVRLHFARGALLAKADPEGLLQGRGTVRHVALHSVADIDRPEIEVLVAAALDLAKVRPVAGAEGPVILRVDSQEKRARRSAKATRPAPARRKAKARR
jgi:hypothetical protein